MRRLEGNAQALQGGNQLMIKMVQRGNQRINVKQKSHKMKCLTQIQSNKLVSIKISFSMSIQGGCLPFVVKFVLLRKLFEVLTQWEISRPYLDFDLINW